MLKLIYLFYYFLVSLYLLIYLYLIIYVSLKLKIINFIHIHNVL